jgi:hypothetical protein
VCFQFSRVIGVIRSAIGNEVIRRNAAAIRVIRVIRVIRMNAAVIRVAGSWQLAAGSWHRLPVG